MLFDKNILNNDSYLLALFYKNVKFGEGYNSFQTLSIVLGVLFFVLRDFLIMLYLQTSSKKKRIGAAFILYLFLLYVVFPGLTSTINSTVALQLFIPLSVSGSFLFPFVECVLLFLIIRNKFK